MPSKRIRYAVIGKHYKTVGGYANALYKKYRSKMDKAFDGSYMTEHERKRQLKFLIKDKMETEGLTIKQAGSAVLNTETFTTSEERAFNSMKKDISELKDLMGMGKGERFRDKSGKFRKLKDVFRWDKDEKAYTFTKYENGQEVNYVARYNWSPKGNQARWIITRAKA